MIPIIIIMINTIIFSFIRKNKMNNQERRNRMKIKKYKLRPIMIINRINNQANNKSKNKRL